MSKALYRQGFVSLSRPEAAGVVRVPFSTRRPSRPTIGPDGMPRRVFIDCSAVDFAKQPTGIPRVVKKYVEIGYAWAARSGIEVIPVVPDGDGLALVRPLPGKGAPAELVSRAAGSGAKSDIEASARIVWDYVRNVVHHGLNFAAALLPIPPIKAASTWIDGLLDRLTAAGDRYVARNGPAAAVYTPRRGDVLLAPAYWHDVDPSIYRDLRARGVEIVIVVHDLLPIVFEHFYPSPWRYLFRDNVRAAFGYASAFVCVSGSTRDALREFGHRNNLEPVPIMVAYNGFEPLVSEAAAAEIRRTARKPLLGNGKLFEVACRKPLLMVGSVEPKKGHLPVIKCLEALWQAGYERPLLIVGRTGWMEQDVVAAIRGSFYFQKKIFWFTDADDYDLAAAYMHCHALVFSSLAEGFGIPMIEAAFYGKPTIALDTPIVREVLGDTALPFGTAAEFVQHVIDLENPANYRAACDAAASLRWPLWQEYTPQVFDRLMDFVASGAALPEQLPARREAPVPLRAAAD